MIELKDWIKILEDRKNLPDNHKHPLEYYWNESKKERMLKKNGIYIEEGGLDYSCGFDIEEFFRLNDINESDKEELCKIFISENYDTKNSKNYQYFQYKIYERLGDSSNTKDLVNKIKELYNIDDIEYVNRNKVTQFSFTISSNDYDNFINNDKIFHLLTSYNYYVKQITSFDDTKEYKLVVEPYKPKEITDIIYNECDGIVYHITNEDGLKGIYSKGFINPKWKNPKDSENPEYRDGRIFVVADKDKNEVRINLKLLKESLKKVKSNKKSYLLKIDLKKYRNKLRFRIDSSASGYRAYFTEEPIPIYCISLIHDDLKEYTNEEKDTLFKELNIS